MRRVRFAVGALIVQATAPVTTPTIVPVTRLLKKAEKRNTAASTSGSRPLPSCRRGSADRRRIPQLVDHTSFNWAVRWISPTLVALVILIEPVGGSILGYLVFGEVPGSLVLAGAAVLLIGVAGAV